MGARHDGVGDFKTASPRGRWKLSHPPCRQSILLPPKFTMVGGQTQDTLVHVYIPDNIVLVILLASNALSPPFFPVASSSIQAELLNVAETAILQEKSHSR